MNFKCYQSKPNLECGYPVSKCTRHLLNVNLFSKIFNFFPYFSPRKRAGWRDGTALRDALRDMQYTETCVHEHFRL